MREEKKYYPMLAGFGKDDFLKEENIRMWEKKHALPKNIQNILMSDEIVNFIFAVERRYNLRDEQTEMFSQLVREYFFGECSDNIFMQKVSQMCHTLPQDILALLRAMNAIVPKENENIQENKKRVEQLSLVDAMAKYPRIKDQEITSKMIISKPFLQALKPTVKNWIMVYEKVLGVNRHDAIERGDFVFRAEATRNLTDEERNLLANVLHSRDDRSPVMIDMDAQKIILTPKNDDVSRINNANLDRGVSMRNLGERAVYSENKAQIEQKNQQVEKRISPQSQISKQTDPRKNPTFDELQKEIIKNRAEMNGEITQIQRVEMKNGGREDMQKEMKIASPSVNMVNAAQQNVNKETTTSNTSAISGTIQFSSNHIMPGEKVVKKDLQATKNYFNMSPIGGVHDTVMQKNTQKNS